LIVEASEAIYGPISETSEVIKIIVYIIVTEVSTL